MLRTNVVHNVWMELLDQKKSDLRCVFGTQYLVCLCWNQAYMLLYVQEFSPLPTAEENNVHNTVILENNSAAVLNDFSFPSAYEIVW